MSQTPVTPTIKSEIKDTLSIGIPLASAQLVYAASSFISTAFVAHLGENALAATVLVSMIWFALIMMFLGVLNSASILVSHQYGAKNYSAISEVMGQTYLLGVAVIFIILYILYNLPWLFQWSHQPPAVIAIATSYIRSLMWTAPPLIFLVISEQFLAGIGRAKIVLRISLLVVPAEIPIIYALVFGKFGLPNCGVAGIGYGFAITNTLAMVGLMLFLHYSKHYQHFKIFAGCKKINLRCLKELIRIGLPMGAQHTLEITAFAVMTFWISQFGTTQLAAHQLVMQFLGFAITLVFAMSQAVGIRVGHAVGRLDKPAISSAIYVGMMMNFCCVAIIALFFNLTPHAFLQIDLNTHASSTQILTHEASILLGISGILMIFDNFRIIIFGALRGLKDTFVPMMMSFVSFWLIGLTLSYIFGFKMLSHASGIWIGMTIGIASGAIMLFLRLQYLLRRLDVDRLVKLSSADEWQEKLP